MVNNTAQKRTENRDRFLNLSRLGLSIGVIITMVLILALCISLRPSAALAKETSSRRDLAKAFLSNVQEKFEKADALINGDPEAIDASQGSNNVDIANKGADGLNLRGLPEGESLIFEITIPPRLLVDGIVFGQVHKGTIILSLRDLISVLNFPIEYDDETEIFSGWFIRETKNFDFDVKARSINAEGVDYTLSDKAQVIGDDVLVPLEQVKAWFATDIDVDVGVQRLALDASSPLPATERAERRSKNYKQAKENPPSLPRYDDGYSLIGVPTVDVTTGASFDRPAEGESDTNRFINLRTTGEFAYGALSTNLNFNEDNELTGALVNYLQESGEPDVLGVLKARRFEAGDVTPTQLPISGNANQETGVRITNVDPLVRLSFPSTRIEGFFEAGWDVELFRENAILNFQETDENGYYAFDNIPLLSERNVFRVVGYGPQGELREEVISIPFDRNRLTSDGGAYDVSLTFQNRQVFEREESQDEDRGTPHFVGFYEKSLSDKTALRVGARYRQEEGDQKLYTSAAVSTTIAGALVNAEIAADEDAELRSELSVLRELGPHRLRADLDLSTDNFNPGQTNPIVQVLSNRLNLEGPSPIRIGDNARYSADLSYNRDSEGTTNLNGFLNLNTQFSRLGVNQIFNYTDSSLSDDGAQVGGVSSLTGSFNKSIVRALATYDFRPDPGLETLSAFWRYRLSNDLETQFSVDRALESGITDYAAQVNWRPDYATITPRIAMDSEGNAEASINTSFSLARVPNSGDIFITRDALSSSGTISAFVFLDKNGNYEFDEDDEPIEDATISIPQNSGGGVTDKNGVAYISQLRPNILTDVFVENGSLADPYWISATEGVSVSPRTGNNIALNFPVHIAGEIDGSVYKNKLDGGREGVGNLAVTLYNIDGTVQQRTPTGPDGFYILTLIPPGQYFLTVEGRNLPSKTARPLPQPINIGYEGTTFFGYDLFMDEGQPDVPVSFLSSLGGAQEQGDKRSAVQGAAPGTAEIALDNAQIYLNLGRFKSRLMMAYIWHKRLKKYGHYLGGSTLLVKPSESKPEKVSGDHVLRVALKENTLAAGYQRCRALTRDGIPCEVEVLPVVKAESGV